MKKEAKLNKTSFMILSYTWGILLTMVGFVVSCAMRLSGRKPKRFGWCRYFDIGKSWGGCECGTVFLKCKADDEHLCEHEFGHAIQNCIYGPLMPLLVNLPSTLRYWYRRIVPHFGVKLKTGYDDIWFERQASELGKKYIAMINAKDESGVK